MDIQKLTSNIDIPTTAFVLRAVVSALGESVKPQWWKTEFINEAGFRFLERLYPRTYLHAAVNSAGQAACGVHDKAVGRIGVYHLFRFPEFLEFDIQKGLLGLDSEFVGNFRRSIGRVDELIEMLIVMSASFQGDEDCSGAKFIGSPDELRKEKSLLTMTALYRKAFSTGKQVFPYFSVQ